MPKGLTQVIKIQCLNFFLEDVNHYCLFSNPYKLFLDLRVKFEGVCAKPYIHNDDRSGKAGWGPVVAYPFPVTTRRPNYQQSRPPYGGSSFQRGPQFQSRPNYGSSISTPGQGRPSGSQSTGSSFQSRPTGSNFYPSGGSGLYESGRPGGSPSRYPAQVVTTRPPYTSGYQTTQSPYTQYTTTTTYRPRESSGSYGSGSSSSSQYRPYPATTTSTAKPWWQEARSRYPASSDNDNVDWRRNNRQLEDDDDVDNEPEEAEYP